jgi:hypothetical protein
VSSNEEYDFFISHASADTAAAEELYEQLAQKRVFFARRSIAHGEEFDAALASALSRSRTIVILISRHSHEAFYERAEIARAIGLYRADKTRFRLVPVYLDGVPPIVDLPFIGLETIQGLDAIKLNGMAGIAAALLDSRVPAPTAPHVVKTRVELVQACASGGVVSANLIRSELITAFATAIPATQASLAIVDANALVVEAAPDDADVGVIRHIDLPDPSAVPPFSFWIAAFNQARLHGPRMVAAMLLSLEERKYSPAALAQRDHLLCTLHTVTG